MSTHNICFYGKQENYPTVIATYSSLLSPLLLVAGFQSDDYFMLDNSNFLSFLFFFFFS